MAKSCFIGRKEIQFRLFRSLSEVQKNSRRKLLNNALWRRISYDLGGGFSSFGKLRLKFVSSRQKATDYMKMLNGLSLAQEGRCLSGEEWNFQQDNTALYNASITKKYLLEQKIRLLDHPACSPDLNHIENLRGLIVAKFRNEVDCTQQFLNIKMPS